MNRAKVSIHPDLRAVGLRGLRPRAGACAASEEKYGKYGGLMQQKNNSKAIVK